MTNIISFMNMDNKTKIEKWIDQDDKRLPVLNDLQDIIKKLANEEIKKERNKNRKEIIEWIMDRIEYEIDKQENCKGLENVLEELKTLEVEK